MSTCWAYLIVSSDSQADTIDDQIKWAEETAAANGWELTRVFRDVGSGNLGVRDLLVHLVAELRATPENARPARVLMTRLDRVGRGKIGPSLIALDEIESMGVVIHTRESGDESASTPEGELIRAVRLSHARFENAVRTDRVRAGIKRRRAHGKHLGTVPYGVILVDGRAQAYEPEALIVRRIYELATNGWGAGRIAHWAAENAPDKLGPDGSMRSVEWSPSTVRSLLRGRTIREIVVGDDAIAAIQRARGTAFRDRAPARHPWPLRGAVRCVCGKTLSGHVGGRSTNQYRYYFCRWHSVKRGQTHPAHRADELEARFVAILERLRARPDDYFAPERQPSIAGLLERERAARKRVDELQRKWQRVWDLAESDDITTQDALALLPQLRVRLDRIEADRTKAQVLLQQVREEIAATRSVAEATEALSEVIDVIAEHWPTAPVELQQRVARVVASLPTVRGLWADPTRPGALLTGVDGAKQSLIEVKISNAPNAPYERSLGNIKEVTELLSDVACQVLT